MTLAQRKDSLRAGKMQSSPLVDIAKGAPPNAFQALVAISIDRKAPDIVCIRLCCVISSHDAALV